MLKFSKNVILIEQNFVNKNRESIEVFHLKHGIFKHDFFIWGTCVEAAIVLRLYETCETEFGLVNMHNIRWSPKGLVEKKTLFEWLKQSINVYRRPFHVHEWE